MNYKHCLIIVFTLLQTSMYANTIEELQQQLSEENNLEKRVKILNDLNWELRHTDYTLAMEYADEALEISQSLDIDTLILASYQAKATAYFGDADYQSAREYYWCALDIAEEIQDSTKILPLKSNLAAIDINLGYFQSSIKLIKENLDTYLKQQDSFKIMSSYINLGVAEQNSGDLLAGIENFQNAQDYARGQAPVYQYYVQNNISGSFSSLEAHELAEQYNREAIKMRESNNLSNDYAGYNNLAITLTHLKRYDEAEEIYQFVLDSTTQLNDRHYANSGLGDIYLATDRLEEADKVLEVASAIAREQEMLDEIGITLAAQAKLAKLKGNYTLSKKLYEAAYQQLNEIDTKLMRSKVLNELILFNAETMPDQELYQQLEEYRQLRTTLLGKQIKNAVIRTRIEYQTQQKEDSIQLLAANEAVLVATNEQQRTANRMLWGGLITFLMISGIVIYLLRIRNQLTQSENQRLELESKRLAEQNSNLNSQNVDLSNQNTILNDENSNLNSEYQTVTAQVSELEEKLRTKPQPPQWWGEQIFIVPNKYNRQVAYKDILRIDLNEKRDIIIKSPKLSFKEGRIVDGRLKEFNRSKLPKNLFLQPNKDTLVNRLKVIGHSKTKVKLINGDEDEITRSFKDRFSDAILGDIYPSEVSKMG